MILAPPRKLAIPQSRPIEMPWRGRDALRIPTLDMAQGNLQVTKQDPGVTGWGGIRMSGLNAQGDGTCPLTMQLSLSGVTQCPGCIVYGDPNVTGCSLKWADGYDINQTFCLDRKYCDCDNETPGEIYPPVYPGFDFRSTCCWRFSGLNFQTIFEKYGIGPPGFDCDCTAGPLDNPCGLAATVCYNRIGKYFGISVFVLSNILPFSAYICIFSAKIDALNCKDTVMSISNDYTGCFNFPTDAPLTGPFPTLPNGLAFGGTATLTPGGC